MRSECVLRLMDSVESSEQERRAQLDLEWVVCWNNGLHVYPPCIEKKQLQVFMYSLSTFSSAFSVGSSKQQLSSRSYSIPHSRPPHAPSPSYCTRYSACIWCCCCEQHTGSIASSIFSVATYSCSASLSLHGYSSSGCITFFASVSRYVWYSSYSLR